MRIARVELYALELPFAEPFILSGGRIDARRSVVVVLHDGEGHVGYGESAPDELPFYSEETLGSARDLIPRVLAPWVAGQQVGSPEAVDAALRENVRGNPFARAGIETAAWDLEAHRRGTGLPQLVAERLGVAPAASFACGVALGIPEDRRAETLTRRVYEALQHGYQRVKIKVAPQWDEVAVRAARAGMAGTDVPLTVDANGAYRWPEHEAAWRALDEAGLLYIEQPLAPDELVGHARLARALKTPLCLDETLRDAGAARQILALEGPMGWNLKVHRVGGLAEACRICRIAAECGAQLWAAPIPEPGIGTQPEKQAAGPGGGVYHSTRDRGPCWCGPAADVIKLSMSRDGRMAVPGVSIARLLDAGRFRSVTRRLQ